MTALVPISDIRQMAEATAKSNLFGIKTVEQAMALMLIAQAEGTHPALAARDFHVIQGRPSLKADAMLARFQQAGGVVEWQDYTDAKVSGKFSHPQACPRPVLIEWTLEQAKRIGLAGKDNWKNYPRQMLRARCISEGVRTAYPGIAVGIYTAEEAQDMPVERHMGNAEIVQELTTDAVEGELTKVAAAPDRESLMAIWQTAAEMCRKAKDAAAHKRIKDAVTAKALTFTAAAPI